MKKIVFLILLLIPLWGNASDLGFQKVKGEEDTYVLKQKNYNLFSGHKQPGLLLTNQNGESVVEVLDKNNDGKLDLIRYSIINKKGELLYTVEDYEMDGVLDLRQTYNKEKQIEKMEVSYSGCWYEIQGNDKSSFIMIGKTKVPVMNSNGKITYNKRLHLDVSPRCGSTP